MVAKKLEYKDANINVVITLDNDSLLTLENPYISSFLSSLFNLQGASGSTMKSFDCTNGLPIYEYIIKRKDDTIWGQNVLIDDSNIEDSSHSMNVPDFWPIKIIQCIMESRKISTELMFLHKVTSISVKWV